MDQDEFARLCAELLADGYAPTPPPGLDPAALDVDREACQQATCPACGRVGLDYLPFSKPGSYRAFAVCPACGAAEEF
jgi:hypothetical protein